MTERTRRDRWRLVGLLLFGLLLTHTARAAEMTVQDKAGLNVIALAGKINPGDAAQFSGLVVNPTRKTVVLLASPGGSVVEALAIGERIHTAGYATMVPAKIQCTSACGLIWLAGTHRYMMSGSRLGFHAAYAAQNGQVRESGVANALIGAYFTRLGLSLDAVMFLTSAPPEQIQWLLPEDAHRLGIAFILVPDTQRQPVAPAAESIQPPAPASPQAVATPALQTPWNARERRAVDFVTRYYSLRSGSAAEAEQVASMYADMVYDHGQTRTRAQVMAAQRLTLQLWPTRLFAAKPGSLAVRCADVCVVSGVIVWQVSNIVNQIRTDGVSTFSFTITDNGSLQIRAETGTSISRQTLPLSGVQTTAATPSLTSTNSAFADGVAARQVFETWFARLPAGQFKEGATFWVKNRTQSLPSFCQTGADHDPNWIMGCEGAYYVLMRSDERRRSEPAYQRGWLSGVN